MYTKRFILLAVFALILINTVSAADNATYENLTDINPGEINVTYDEQMWEKNLSDINVELPENSTGDFCVKINDEVIYNQTITDRTFKVPIKLPSRGPELYIAIFPPIDSRTYRVSAFYNDVEVSIPHDLKVMRMAPDFNYFHFPEEVLYKENRQIILAMPRSSNGILELYLDGKLLNKTKARPMMYIDAQKWVLGKHALKVVYYNDTYYNGYNNTFTIEVTRAVISIPGTLNIGHDDCISIETLRGTEGTVEVYLDGKLIDSGKLEYGDYILSLEKYLKRDSSKVTVVLKTTDFTRTKTQNFNVEYDFDVFAHSLVYGQSNVIEVILPDTLNNKLLHIQIDGKSHPFKKQDLMNNAIEIDTTKLGPGNHTLFISYDGDARFKPQNKTYNFTIDYKIISPYRVTYQTGSKVYLKLPSDAKGNLTVNIRDKLFKTVKFNNGYAEIKLDTLEPGTYKMDVYYDGDDYNVTEYRTYIYSSPKTIIDHTFTKGENAYIILKAPKTTSGYMNIIIDGKTHKVNIKDGYAKYSLKNLKTGDHEVEIYYKGNDGYDDFLNWVYVTVNKPKIKYMACEASFKGLNLKMKLLTKKGKTLSNKKVTIKFNGKTYKLKTNKNGIITLKKAFKLKNKKYALKIQYMDVKITKKLKVKPISMKINTAKKKLIIKATIDKKLKNRIIKFKINKKTIKVKTNSKGVAKITVKKAKTMKIKATYKKSTVKETI